MKRGGTGEPAPHAKRVPRPPRYSMSLQRGLAFLGLFSNEVLALSIADLKRRLELTQSTTHRYASTLAALGYLAQNPSRAYRLAPGAARPGIAMLNTIARRTYSEPILKTLREIVGHTVGLVILGDHQGTYVQRFHAHGQGQYAADMSLRTGAHIPLHSTAAGKAILATLSEDRLRSVLNKLSLTETGPSAITDKNTLVREIERVKSDGIALSDDEHARGVRSIAVPVKTPYGEHPLAVDITLPTSPHTSKQLLSRSAPHLKTAAREISDRLDETHSPPS